MFGLSDIFKSDAQKAASPQPAPVAAPTPVAATPVPTQAPTQDIDPLDNLWKNDPNAPKPQPGMDFSINPQQLADIAGKIDYRQAITPEIRARIAAGGEDGLAATMEAINVANQMNFQQTAIASTRLIEAAITATESTLDSKIDARLKLGGLNESLNTENPALSNPRYAPLVNMAKQEILAKFPNASQAEIAKYTTRYLQEFAASANPDLVKKANTNTQVGLGNLNNMQPETDWAEWLNTGTG
jgi:hypothetical protein